MYKWSKKEYLNTEDPEKYAIGLIYAKKNCTNVFKLFYYICISSLGYYVLSQTNFFPKELFGHGEISNCFAGGYPNWIYFTKPELFNVYYLVALAYHLTDLVWLLGIYELQTDFKMMLVHHICTISLVVFSYLCNYSHLGSIIMFLHDFGDIFVYIARILLNTSFPETSKTSSGIVLLIVWIYTRLYVFAGVIFSVYRGFAPDYNLAIINIIIFLCFLYVLHIYWVYLIFKKICMALFGKIYEDTFKVSKVKD